MDAPTIAFRLDDAVDPARELGVVETRRVSDGASTLRVWNVEHGAYVCEHLRAAPGSHALTGATGRLLGDELMPIAIEWLKYVRKRRAQQQQQQQQQ